MSPPPPTCPHCGSTDVVRDREKDVEVSCLVDGRVGTRRGRVLRVACRAVGCGRHGTIRNPADVSAERKVRDHVVSRLFALGQTGAHEETGLGRATVQRHAEAWSAVREHDVGEAAPGLLLVANARLRSRDAVLVADGDRRTLVEILDGAGAFRDWIARPGRLPALRACIPIDPSVRDVVRQALPKARIMVAPATAARAIRSLGLRALGTMRRDEGGRGSNGFPRNGEFVQAAAGDADTGGWPFGPLALLSAVRTALSVVAAPDRAAGERLWPEFEMAAAHPGAKGLLGLMREWRDAILEGLSHRFLDGAVALLGKVRRSLSARRPALGFADLRRYALLRGFERRIEGMGRTPVARGACLVVLCRELAAAP